ncbi:cytochrome P450 [Podospora australis]|uniref:Cytochrome P450 n=1 Tax=Podospora australis TaxID=1536484 RepID=A0AAN7AFF7_9PEZI|nr:cytochrome P450 [Podospora australis]
MSQPTSSPNADPNGGLGFVGSGLKQLSIPSPTENPIPYFFTTFLFVVVLYALSPKTSSVRCLNPRKPFEFSNLRAKKLFMFHSREIMGKWFKTAPEEPVRVIADVGEVLLLPAKFANEIKSDDRLTFSKFVYSAFHAHIPGFEGFKEGGRDSHIVQAVIMKDLTKYLNKVTEPLSNETSLAVEEIFAASGSKEWQPVTIREALLRLVAQVSSRVFLGEELCRNDDWLAVTRDYTVHAFRAAEELRLFPYYLRSVVHWFLPSCQKARADVKKARKVIDPLLEQRRALKARGDKVEFDDAIEWFEREAQGKEYDAAVSQLILAVAAIHTTTDLVTQVLGDLVRNPDMIQPVRDEIVTTLREGGWKKTTLYNMKLLDSVIKESQRIKPVGLISMRRIAEAPITLSDGTFIPKSHAIGVSASRMWDPAVYPEPETWKGKRFYDLRSSTGNEHVAQLVSTSPEHLGFGHGQHACPGRFFAANEVKIILAHLLIGFDWRLPDGTEPKIRSFAFSLGQDPTLKMEYRAREKEIEL